MHAAAASAHVGNSGSSQSGKKSAGRNSSKQPLDLEDLVEEEEEKKNWKGIIIAVLVIVTVLSLIIVAIFLVTPDPEEEQLGDKLTFDEFIEGAFEPVKVVPIWSKDGKHLLYKNSANELIDVELEENVTTHFLDNSTFRELNTKEFLISADKSYILFPYHYTGKYQHSGTTRYKLYNTDTRLYRELIGPRGTEFQYVTWSNSGQGLIVVQDNNIFFKPRFADLDAKYRPITSSGLDNTIYNGVPDWLYKEEILRTDHALWLSEDDRYLMYATFNDTKVDEMVTVFYGDPRQQYTEARKQRYPKVGMTISEVTLHVYDFRTGNTSTVTTPPTLKNSNHYFRSATWRTRDSMAVVWMARTHNVSIVTICSAGSGTCYENLRNEKDYGWMHASTEILFTTDKTEYFIILPRKDGEKGLVHSVAMVDASVNIQTSSLSGKKLFLTDGQTEVVKIAGYYSGNQSVYFIGIPSDDPRQRHLYKTTKDKDDPSFLQATCITCNQSDKCLFVDATFGVSDQYYILECLGPDVPSYSLYHISGTLVLVLEDNARLKQLLSTKLMPVYDYMMIPQNDEIYIHSKLIMPATLKKDEVIRFNLILVINEHIGEQTVTHRFSVGWDEFMASTHGIIIAHVDTRGTSGRGEIWSQSIYGHVGVLEVDDIITTLRTVKQLIYVHERIAIVGKGYGGLLGISSLTMDNNDVAQCGVAISPIQDLGFMDASYEKYMYSGEKYTHNNPRSMKNIGKHHLELLLMHGTGDETIHFQNTAQYVKYLIESDVPHLAQIYPDIGDLFQDETISSRVYTDMENFLLKCFQLPLRNHVIEPPADDGDDE